MLRFQALQCDNVTSLYSSNFAQNAIALKREQGVRGTESAVRGTDNHTFSVVLSMAPNTINRNIHSILEIVVLIS